MLWRKAKDFMTSPQRLLSSSLTWGTLGVTLWAVIFGSTTPSIAQLDTHKVEVVKVAVFLQIPDTLTEEELKVIQPRKMVLDLYLQDQLKALHNGNLKVIIVSDKKTKPDEGIEEYVEIKPEQKIEGYVRKNKIHYYISGRFRRPFGGGSQWTLRWKLVEAHPDFDRQQSWRSHRPPEPLIIRGDSEHSDLLAMAKEIKEYFNSKLDVPKPFPVVFTSCFQVLGRLADPLQTLPVVLPGSITTCLKGGDFEKKGYKLDTLPLSEVQKCCIKLKESIFLKEKSDAADYIIVGVISMLDAETVGIKLDIMKTSKKETIPLRTFEHPAGPPEIIAQAVASFIEKNWDQAVAKE